MSSKIEIDSVVLRRILDDAVYINQLDRQSIRDALAAPVVERQPAAVYIHKAGLERLAGSHVKGCAASLAKVPTTGFVRIYTAPPELAELQATIDRLTAEFGRLKKAWHASVKVTTQDVMQAIEEIPGAPMLTSNHCHALAMRLNFFIDKVKELNQ